MHVHSCTVQLKQFPNELLLLKTSKRINCFNKFLVKIGNPNPIIVITHSKSINSKLIYKMCFFVCVEHDQKLITFSATNKQNKHQRGKHRTTTDNVCLFEINLCSILSECNFERVKSISKSHILFTYITKSIHTQKKQNINLDI